MSEIMLSLKGMALRLMLKPLNFLCQRYHRLGSHIHANLDVPSVMIKTKHGDLLLNVDSPVMLMRAKTFFDKEPETLEWIDSMSGDDVLYDVGSNVGIYSLYAAIKGLNVYAFEPESLNYAELNKHIYNNNLSEKIKAYNIGLADKTVFDQLNLSTFKKGWSMHTATTARDFEHKEFTPSFEQGLFVVSLDDLVNQFGFPVPTYLKIDVDGLESEIINGGLNVIKDPNLKSILIELNESCPKDIKMIELIQTLGFSRSEKRQSPLISPEHSAVFNYIFRRL